MRSSKEKNHLPVYGIGPLLCSPMAMMTAVGIYCSSKGILPGVIENKAINIILLVAGVLLILEGIVLFFAADLNGALKENIEANKLKTNGSYKYVRNPCYCLFLLGCTGAILIAHNVLLFALPVLFYIEMTVVLIHTEEKWLADLYGQEYANYCKRVNRCIPWFPRKQ